MKTAVLRKHSKFPQKALTIPLLEWKIRDRGDAVQELTAERSLIRRMLQLGFEENTIVKTLSVLDTEQNYEKMISEVEKMTNPLREAMLFTALIITCGEG